MNSLGTQFVDLSKGWIKSLREGSDKNPYEVFGLFFPRKGKEKNPKEKNDWHINPQVFLGSEKIPRPLATQTAHSMSFFPNSRIFFFFFFSSVPQVRLHSWEHHYFSGCVFWDGGLTFDIILAYRDEKKPSLRDGFFYSSPPWFNLSSTYFSSCVLWERSRRLWDVFTPHMTSPQYLKNIFPNEQRFMQEA